MQSTNTQRPLWHLPEQAAAYVLATGTFATLGPFGTFDLAFWMRLIYWTLAIGAGWVFVSASIMTMRRKGLLHYESPILRLALSIMIAAPPTALVVLVLEEVFRPGDGPFLKPHVFLYVAFVCLVIGGTMIAYVRPRLTQPVKVPSYMIFMKRLPPQLGTDLLSLSSQDHYVEVTTTKGRDLIHMRLGDALEELRDYPGQQVHRSHWIAARAFSGTSRENNRLVVHLNDGRTLPVSRSFAIKVREMTPKVDVPD
ncbi:LytTR family DNA-binding domain-containing protein [uncultured Shimia sp.]|uniref:LytTR family DNA-binding domain-containing protein n=1 Tax=uncultured Shimia sp. TaxID=573152 RepID=UPI0026091DB3|nr:LytTR family DNA-binding domain-containing protein [uncultured Shimia sp.]